jgi:hypothetical protein
MGEDLEMVRSLVRSYMLGEQVDVAYCMTTLLAMNDRLRAELEAVRAEVNRLVGGGFCEGMCAGCQESIIRIAALSNEGGDDG